MTDRDKLNGAAPTDSGVEIYVLTDEQHVRALLMGAAALGIVPSGMVSRVSRARFEQVSNGATLQLWTRPAASPPPDTTVLRDALVRLLGESVPAMAEIATWSREQIEEVAEWAVLAKRSLDANESFPVPPTFLARPGEPKPKRKRRTQSDPPGEPN
jgi:hypothetical protein